MQITLSQQTAALALELAAESGYGDDVASFVTHLIVVNQSPPSCVPSPRTKAELDALLEEGLASGLAEGSWEDFMADLRSRLDAKMRREAS